ncbi:hypothetical protein [Streptomyces lannensis]|uniref:Integral membrane protein n=1 Tax=Streptomyces lannensis TaxID=766498 RepID=A0ABP7KAU6_9ACTN
MEQSKEPYIGPRAPHFLGYPEASATAQTVAAPLLAGAALSLVGVIIVDGGDFRWPGVTLLLVVMSAIALIATMQIGADARKYLYNRQTIEAWYAPEDLKRSSELLERRSAHFIQWQVRNRRAVVTFNTGTMLLIFSVATALVPPHDEQAAWRWAAAGLALAGALVEAWWIRHLFHEDPGGPPEKPKSLNGGDG